MKCRTDGLIRPTDYRADIDVAAIGACSDIDRQAVAVERAVVAVADQAAETRVFARRRERDRIDYATADRVVAIAVVIADQAARVTFDSAGRVDIGGDRRIAHGAVADIAVRIADQAAHVIRARDAHRVELDVCKRAARAQIAEQALIVIGTGNREVRYAVILPVISTFERVGFIADCREINTTHVDVRRLFECQGFRVIDGGNKVDEILQIGGGCNLKVIARFIVLEAMEIARIGQFDIVRADRVSVDAVNRRQLRNAVDIPPADRRGVAERELGAARSIYRPFVRDSARNIHVVVAKLEFIRLRGAVVAALIIPNAAHIVAAAVLDEVVINAVDRVRRIIAKSPDHGAGIVAVGSDRDIDRQAIAVERAVISVADQSPPTRGSAQLLEVANVSVSPMLERTRRDFCRQCRPHFRSP